MQGLTSHLAKKKSDIATNPLKCSMPDGRKKLVKIISKFNT